jgi:hypothetical protein
VLATPGVIDGAMPRIASRRSGFYAAKYPGINEDRLGRLTWALPKIMRIRPSLPVHNQVETSEHCPSHVRDFMEIPQLEPQRAPSQMRVQLFWKQSHFRLAGSQSQTGG